MPVYQQTTVRAASSSAQSWGPPTHPKGQWGGSAQRWPWRSALASCICSLAFKVGRKRRWWRGAIQSIQLQDATWPTPHVGDRPHFCPTVFSGPLPDGHHAMFTGHKRDQQEGTSSPWERRDPEAMGPRKQTHQSQFNGLTLVDVFSCQSEPGKTGTARSFTCPPQEGTTDRVSKL